MGLEALCFRVVRLSVCAQVEAFSDRLALGLLLFFVSFVFRFCAVDQTG